MNIPNNDTVLSPNPLQLIHNTASYPLSHIYAQHYSNNHSSKELFLVSVGLFPMSFFLFGNLDVTIKYSFLALDFFSFSLYFEDKNLIGITRSSQQKGG